MGLFRRRSETYNEQMLREAGLAGAVIPEPTPVSDATTTPAPPPAPVVPGPNWSPDLLHHGRLGPKEWDAAVTVTAPGLAGDRIEFVTLPDGDVIVSEEEGDGDVSPLADAIEEHVSPPYRAVANRQRDDLWGVGARQIEVAQIPFPDADSLELSRKDSWEERRVDGEPADVRIPELERLGDRAGADFFVKAERIDGDFWEVRVSAL